MTRIDFPQLMTQVFVEVDDWCACHGPQKRFSDSELLTLASLKQSIK